MKKQTTKYYTLILLIFLFAAPGIAAYLFYSHPSWLGTARINKGSFLANPIELSSIEKKEKWRIIFWTPTSCDNNCLSQIDLLARVRLALGRKLYLVEQILVVNKDSLVESSLIENELKNKDFMVHVLSDKDRQALENLSNKAQIFIMDPGNHLVLSYKSGVKPDDVYKDLKLLLTTYETKKG